MAEAPMQGFGDRLVRWRRTLVQWLRCGCTTAVVHVDEQGRLSFVHRDELSPLLTLGTPDVRRASVVNWTAAGWVSNLSPVCGPMLGPFPTRAGAVAAEVAWLEKTGPTPPEFMVRMGLMGTDSLN